MPEKPGFLKKIFTEVKLPPSRISTGELFIMLMVFAIPLDLLNVILLLVGLDDFWMGDLIGLLFIGIWTISHGGDLKITKSAKKNLPNAVKTIKWLRPLSFLTEIIPYVGVLPGWTAVVLSTYFAVNSAADYMEAENVAESITNQQELAEEG